MYVDIMFTTHGRKSVTITEIAKPTSMWSAPNMAPLLVHMEMVQSCWYLRAKELKTYLTFLSMGQ